MTPIHGRRMRRYEPARWGIAVTEGPICGRPAGHTGKCLSQMCLARDREYRRQRDRRRAEAAQAGLPSPGQRIRETRHWAGMSQQALAAALGVTQATISHWESDRFNPGAAMLLEVAAAAGAPASWLLPGLAVREAA
jgi:DNA-binding transcriptional regulator YiaG